MLSVHIVLDFVRECFSQLFNENNRKAKIIKFPHKKVKNVEYEIITVSKAYRFSHQSLLFCKKLV